MKDDSLTTASQPPPRPPAPVPAPEEDEEDEPDFLKLFLHKKPSTPLLPTSNTTKASLSHPPIILPSTRPPLFDLTALTNLGKALYSAVVNSEGLAGVSMMGLEEMVERAAGSVGGMVRFDPGNVPVVTSALEDGIRITVKVDVTNPTMLPVFLPGPFNLDLLHATEVIGHVLISNIRLSPLETYPHEIHVLYSPQTPSSQQSGGRFLGSLASGTPVQIEVGVADIASLVRGMNVPEVMKRGLWEALKEEEEEDRDGKGIVTPPTTPPPVPPKKEGGGLPGSYPVESTMMTERRPSVTLMLRNRLEACLRASRITQTVPSPCPGGMLVRCRFKMMGGGFGIGTSPRGRAVTWATLRNPFNADVTVLRIVGTALVRDGGGWRGIGTVDTVFGRPGEDVRGGEVFVVPFTTLNPRIVVVSPPIEVEAAVDCRAFGSLMKAIRRKLEVRVEAKLEVMIGRYGPIVLDYQQDDIPCSMGAP
ncbi:hypothetical protein HDU67_000609 [Dinochytrium kinnereticum]|nr:hypothetical protein HDU67_000609 [Dinochytrium kinnereticum]